MRHQAAVEDVDYRAARGLDRTLFQTLIAGCWIDEAQNLVIEGPAGVGKSWLACALGHKACRDNRSVLYQRAPKLFADLALARGDGRYPRLMRALDGVKLLILDDWGLAPLRPEQRHTMLEIVEDRYGRGATLITSQIPADRCHSLISEPPWPTPSWTASFTMPIACSSGATVVNRRDCRNSQAVKEPLLGERSAKGFSAECGIAVGAHCCPSLPTRKASIASQFASQAGLTPVLAR